MGRGRWAVPACGLVVLLAGAWPAGSQTAADHGAPTFAGCLSNDGGGGLCVDVPGAPLRGAAAVAVSADGRSVYVASAGSDSVSHFSRPTAGTALVFAGCLSNDGSRGACVDLPGAPIDEPVAVAVSPDGASVYVTSSRSDSLAHLVRTPDGAISFAGCVSDGGAGGSCVDLPGSILEEPTGVAVSPDGASVYVASAGSGSLTHFARHRPGGQVALVGCLASTGAAGFCGDLPGAPLDGADAVAVGPDGTSVYVASETSDSLSWFTRAAGGTPSFGGCLANTSAKGACTDLPEAPLDGARQLAVSPDGGTVHVVSYVSDSVSRFVRQGGSPLIFGGCLSNDGSRGACADLPGTPIEDALGVAVSPDGGSIYAVSEGSDSLAYLTAGTPPLAFSGCLADTARGGCLEVSGPPLDDAAAVAVSPDGGSVYVAARGSGTLSVFARRLAAPALLVRRTATCNGRPATIVGTLRADRMRGTPRVDVIAGLGGADVIRGLGGDDVICGGPGADRLAGDTGRDVLKGGSARDVLRGGAGRDVLVGGSGRDILRGGAGRDALRGGPGRDIQQQEPS